MRKIIVIANSDIKILSILYTMTIDKVSDHYNDANDQNEEGEQSIDDEDNYDENNLVLVAIIERPKGVPFKRRLSQKEN